MRLSDNEFDLLRIATRGVQDTPVIQTILRGKYGKPTDRKRKGDAEELDRFRSETLLYAVLVPLARQFFLGRHNHFFKDEKTVDDLELFLTLHLQDEISGKFREALGV